MKKYNAVILGGGKSLTNSNLPKGNTPFNGGSLAGRVYKSAINGFDFNRAALVMNPDKRIKLRTGDTYVNPTSCKGAWLSGYEGIKAINDDDSAGYVLIAGDLAFFNDVTMDAFMDEVKRHKDTDILIPLIPRDINERDFPQRERTYQPLREGEFLAGNLGYISKGALQKNEYLIKDIATSYQKKMKFISMTLSHLGISSVLRSNHPKLPIIKSIPFYEKLFPKFSIQELNERASKFSKSKVKFFEFPHSRASFDIDKLEQLQLAKKIHLTGLEAKL
ncbi:MAG: nucleotidyltransferase family protein [Nanoarchaeota archaeon]|nr:nucleotidyltransferase family protein [Nanoarchaeota archaeon]